MGFGAHFPVRRHAMALAVASGTGTFRDCWSSGTNCQPRGLLDTEGFHGHVPDAGARSSPRLWLVWPARGGVRMSAASSPAGRAAMMRRLAIPLPILAIVTLIVAWAEIFW